MLTEKLTGQVIDETRYPDCLAIAFPDMYARDDADATGDETMTAKMSIKASALRVGGCSWEDREQVGTLADQLRALAGSTPLGGDCDLTDSDRAELRTLADAADDL